MENLFIAQTTRIEMICLIFHSFCDGRGSLPGVWKPTESHSAAVCLEKGNVTMIAANQTEEEGDQLLI